MKFSTLTKLTTGTGALAIALASAPAFAQDEGGDDASADGDAPIIVTGSRIARPDLEASSPVTVVSAEEIRISGNNNVEEFLRDLPQAVGAIGGNSNNGNDGSATIDLRNLGEERTLVLVNGKRFVPFDAQGFVDLNMIPSALVKRVEVLTGGASAIYGSDAVAGVVNFIMDDNFEGFEGDVQYGLSEHGDAQNFSASITIGMNSGDGRGNIVANATYVKVDPLTQGARSFSEFSLAAADFSPGGSSTNPSGAIDSLLALGGRGQFDGNGNLIPYVDSRDAFNFNPFNLLVAPQNKWTGTILGRYELSDAVEFFGRASFANSRVTTVIAPTGTFGFPFQINYLDNPFLTAQASSILAGNDTAAALDPNPGDGIVTVNLRRRLTELGTRDSIYENTAYQFVGGFRGDISDSVRWELFGQWGRTSRTITYANDVSFSNAQQALLAVDGPNGPVCIDPSGGCQPANYFGANNLSAEAGNFIRLDLQQNDSTNQLVVGGFITADLPFTLMSDVPGGIVIGAEHRTEETNARPDNNLVTGNSIGFGSSTPIRANIRVNEVYGEVNVPIITDRPFFDSLSVEAGARYSDYRNEDQITGQSNAFTNWTYKIGLEWSPIPDIKIRGGYNRAVRAPRLDEIGQPLTPSTGDAVYDHCESVDNGQPLVLSPAVVNDPNRSQEATNLLNLCVATGVPLGALQAGLVESIVSGQLNNYVGGNINLTPEKADTYTIGAVIEPGMLPGFTASVDFYDIKITNPVFEVPEQETLIACYEVEQDANGTFCSRIIRNPLNGSLQGGTETGVVSTRINAGFFRSRGIDISAQYGFDIFNDSKLTFSVNATRTLKSDFQTQSVFDLVRECEGAVGPICLRPLPKWRWIQNTRLDSGPLSVQLRWYHIGSLTNDGIRFGTNTPDDFVVPTIKAYNYFDLYSSVEVMDNLTFRAGVNNIFDKQPPTVGNDYGGTTENSGNTYPATYDPVGRSFFVGATFRF